MENLFPTTPAASYRRRSLVLFTIFLIVVLFDFISFARQALHYTNQAIYGGFALPPKIDSEAIVVLTGDQRRIPKAIELLRNRGSSVLIISGTGKGTTLTDLVNVQGDAILHVPEVWGKIILESKSSSTVENAIETGKILSERKISRVILTTSDYHLWRSQLIFKKYLPQYDYFLYPVASVLGDISWGSLEMWLVSWLRLFTEYVKWAFFRWTFFF